MKNTSIKTFLNSLLTMTLLAVCACDQPESSSGADSERLVVLRETSPEDASLKVSYENFLAWRDATHEWMATSAHVVTDLELQGEEPRIVRASHCTVDYFDTLETLPFLGRTFVPGDLNHDGFDVAVLSYELWQQRFAGQPEIIGGQITLDGRDHVVLGVLPDEVRFPDETGELWRLLKPTELQGGHELTVISRLAPGISSEEAQRELNKVELPCGHGVSVVALRDAMSD